MEIVQQQYRVSPVLSWITGVRGMFVFALLMSLSAAVKIPLFFSPVPLSLQTFVLLLSIVCLRNTAWGAQGLYLLIGSLGFPAFTSMSFNALYLLGPTGGYLAGFLLAAGIGGSLVSRISAISRIQLAGIFLLAELVLYICGASWLHIQTGSSITRTLSLGVYPFMIGDAIKLWCAVVLGVRLHQSISAQR